MIERFRRLNRGDRAAPGPGRTRALPHAIAAGLVGLAALVAPASPLRADPTPPDGIFAPTVEIERLQSFDRAGKAGTRFGALEWLGGLVIRSPSPHFGGLSGIATADHGRDLLMISDVGFWLSARLDSDAAGRPIGLSGIRMASVVEQGRRLLDKRDADAESLAVRPAPGGFEAIVGFETRHRILRFPFAVFPTGALTAVGERLNGIPGETATLAYGKGLESLAAAPPGSPIAGAIVAIAEGPRRNETDSLGWIIGGPKPGRFAVALSNDFMPTDAAFLPGGDLLVLERRFTVADSLGARIRRFAAVEIVPGARLEGRILFQADLSDEIDNMEGLAVDTAEDGATILTLISDDNRSILQRTLLLRFRLLPE
jgi:hypothetical protein